MDADVMDLAPRLRRVRERLDGILRGIEPVFLEAGGHLSAAVDRLGGLTGGFAAMAARLEADDTRAAIATLRGLSTRIGGLADSTRSSDERLQGLQALAGELVEATAA